MDMTSSDKKRYIAELCRLTGGKTTAQVSMFDVGAAMGLEKETARRLAEDLIADGMVEIKTLSGGIGITGQGLEMAPPMAVVGSGAAPRLSNGPILDEKDRQALEGLLTAVKEGVCSSAKPYSRMEEMMIDIKTIDVHLLSPRPKTAVIKAVLKSLANALKDAGAGDLAGQLDEMAGA